MSAAFSISICICTSGRARVLQRCLDSLAPQANALAEVLVSDDSADSSVAAAIQEMCQRQEFVRYLAGPRRGLCANRNHIIRHVQSSHVSLLDDDAVASDDFVETANRLIAVDANAIWTGSVMEQGALLTAPSNATRLGFFGRALLPGEPLQNINLNCNVIPKLAFSDAGFDEWIRYGYEDMDVCDRWVRKGWQIRHEPKLVNAHFPPSPDLNQSARRTAESNIARVYVGSKMTKRERGTAAALGWSAVVLAHELLAALKHRRLPQLLNMACAGWRAVRVPEAPVALSGSQSDGPVIPNS